MTSGAESRRPIPPIETTPSPIARCLPRRRAIPFLSDDGDYFGPSLTRAANRRAAHGARDNASAMRYQQPMVDLTRITPGLIGQAEIIVTPDRTAPFVGSGRIAVLATPVMINVIEAAALNAVEHLLPAGHQSLGIHLDVKHFAATPVGLRVTATAEVTAVEGRTIRFRVEARDEREPIGGGTHERVVVSVARFDERVQRKLRG
jgi:predicted thioesterase